jgi:Tol biopolymer transport system component
MKPIRVIPAVVFLAVSATVGVPSATAVPRGGQPSTKGVIVWTNRASAGSEHLLIASADGSHQRSLTAALPDTGDIDAQISPTGSWIAYEHDTADTADVRLVRPDGTRDHVINVGCVDPCVAAAAPTWLSNTRLAFVLVKGPFDPQTGNAASAVLWSSRLDGSDIRRLSQPGIDGTYEDAYVHVSPDRSYLTFQRRRNSDGQSALFRMTPRGTDLRQLTPWEIRAEVNDLSTARRGPTADLLVFESYGRGDPNATFVDIATVPTTCTSLANCTSKIRWLTDNKATGRRNANPQWSPDATSLVFTNRPNIVDQNADIWTMQYLGTERRKISTSVNFDYRPTWGKR